MGMWPNGSAGKFNKRRIKMRSAKLILAFFAVSAAIWGMSSGIPVRAQAIGVSVQTQQISGKVISVDALVKSLKLQPEAKAITSGSSPQPTNFVVDEKTSIIKGIQPLKLDDLKIGDQVRIDYAPQDGKNVAKSIIVENS